MSAVQGKTVVVTGPTSGLGWQIAHELGAMGARLVLGCRDVARGEAVAAEIAARPGAHPPLVPPLVLPVDAASRASIEDFARACRAQCPRIDVLVNNAGLASGTRRVTPEGLELTFATNVLGYQRLTLALLDLLTASAPARIVNVASLFAGDLDLDHLQFVRRPYQELEAYAQSKACNRMLSWALARRLEGSGVTVNAYAPGFVPGTGLARNMSPELRAVYQVRTGRSLAQGADTAVWLASAPEVEGLTGRFWSDRRELACQFRGETGEERLWEICASMEAAPT
jgi:NAD(P)-dependent dehydrogenase (short-subunit alcohol dehydrogenase family)